VALRVSLQPKYLFDASSLFFYPPWLKIFKKKSDNARRLVGGNPNLQNLRRR